MAVILPALVTLQAAVLGPKMASPTPAFETLPVEVIVNGYPVEQKEIVADGSEHELTFAVPIKQSSWVALRILASSHTNPVFVLVDGKPIRANAACGRPSCRRRSRRTSTRGRRIGS